jgi:hypothetical protein
MVRSVESQCQRKTKVRWVGVRSMAPWQISEPDAFRTDGATQLRKCQESEHDVGTMDLNNTSQLGSL